MKNKISKAMKAWIFIIIILLVVVVGTRVIFYSEFIIPRDKPSTIGEENMTPELNASETEGGGETEAQIVNVSDDACVALGCSLGTRYVGTKDTRKYHYCWCELAESSSRGNLVCFDNAVDAVMRDYRPCEVCKPPQVT